MSVVEPDPAPPRRVLAAPTQRARSSCGPPVDVTRASATAGAQIMYPPDGSAPTLANGTLYASPIAISRTTTLRAAAFFEDLIPTNVDTHTYIFVDQVREQTGAGFPGAWGSRTADYEVDPEVTGNPAYSATFRDDLLSIPSMSIVMDLDDLFGSRGIYSNPGGSGQSWERPSSVELILPDGVEIPGMVTQISDGENSRTMLPVFPHRYREAIGSLTTSGVVMLGGSEYLELVEAAGVRFEDFIPIQPIHQHRIWALAGRWGRRAVDQAIDRLRNHDESFHLEGGAWVADRSWVHGYASVLQPMQRLSQLFHEKTDDARIDPNEPRYCNALLYLLLSQTSCLRYWGRGRWTDFAHEFCRRGTEILTRRF